MPECIRGMWALTNHMALFQCEISAPKTTLDQRRVSDYSANKEQLILEFDWITTLQTRFSLADSTIRHSTVFLINLAKYDVRKKKK